MKKVVLVTGASTGIGAATATHLAKHGYIVYGAARRVEKLNTLQADGIVPLPMDVTDDHSMVRGIEQIIANEGRIDVLINNAGFGSYGALEDVPMEDAKYQLEVNVFGAARLMQLVIPHMRRQHSGKIVNVSSIGGKVSMPLGGWYHASKFALEALSDALRNEVRSFGIDVIVIEPGGIRSEWGGIATDSLKKVSGNTVYKPMVEKFSKAFQAVNDKTPEPVIIGELIRKAIASAKPKTRYAAGYMAAPILFFKKVLSDRMMDKMLMSQIK